MEEPSTSPPKVLAFQNESESVTMRKDSETESPRKRVKERTPTSVVSEMFDFLNSSISPESDEQEKGDAVEIFGTEPGIPNVDESLADKLCRVKDSGFASLERNLNENVYENITHINEKLEEKINSIQNKLVDESDLDEESNVETCSETDPTSENINLHIDVQSDKENIDEFLSAKKEENSDEILLNNTNENVGEIVLNFHEKASNACADSTEMSSIKSECLEETTVDYKDSIENDQFSQMCSLKNKIEGCEENKSELLVSKGVIDISDEKSPNVELNFSETENRSAENLNQNFLDEQLNKCTIEDTIVSNSPNKREIGKSEEMESSCVHMYLCEQSDNCTVVDLIYSNTHKEVEPVKSEQRDSSNVEQKDDSKEITTGSASQTTSENTSKLNYEDTKPESTQNITNISVSNTSSSDIEDREDLLHICSKKTEEKEEKNDKEIQGNNVRDTENNNSTPESVLREIESIPTSEETFLTEHSTETKEGKTDNACVVRRKRLEKNPSAEVGSDDSSDEDTGIYAESFRRSNWVRVSKEGKLELKMPASDETVNRNDVVRVSTAGESQDTGPESPIPEEVFQEPLSQADKVKMMHRRSESTTTTVSEHEFQRQYVSRRKCLVKRADSQQEYHRLSSMVYDQDKVVVLERHSGNNDLGLHLLDSHPAFITSVDPGSAAEKAGIQEGQILVSVNDQNVLTTDHADIVTMIQNSQGGVQLGVANSDFQPVRDLQACVLSGFMYKLGNSSLMKIWKKRFFVLRQDNCLYYYKNEQQLDPLGAIPLGGYVISRHVDTNKEFSFKAEKYGARTYYLMTDSRDQMAQWVTNLTEATTKCRQRKESLLSVSSSNVSLPALEIRRPECFGYLHKLDSNRRTWRKRYCVLKDACVYYYRDMTSLNALGVSHLHGYSVDFENFQKRRFSFSLQPPEKKMRVFRLSVENETDKKRWVEALIHSIQRWVKVDREMDC